LLDAVSSGVEILYNTSLAGVDGGSRVIAKLVQNKLGEAGGDGRRSFEPIQGSDFSMACDFIVFAIGKVADYELVRACGARCALGADGEGLRIGADSKVFAGGDLANGGATVVEAVRHGKAAAMSILEMLGLREAAG
jgi:glutamate synthase (NADPH/NADH) small chain